MYDELVKRLREEANSWCINCCYRTGECICAASDDHKRDCDIYSKLEAADAIEELSKAVLRLENESGIYDELPMFYIYPTKWVSVEERLPECEWGAEVGNIEWISCGMVFAGCFGRGGKYRDAYFRTWTDGTEGIDAKGADYWRLIQIPEPPKEES